MKKIGGIGGRKCKLRKRGNPSPSSSWKYRVFWVEKRTGSSTPVPDWKMMSSKSSSMVDDKSLAGNSGEDANGLSVWKLGARLGSMALALSNLSDSHVSKRMDSPRRMSSVDSQRNMPVECNLGDTKYAHDCLVEFDRTRDRTRSERKNIIRSRNSLKDVYNGLITSQELLKVLSRISRVDQRNSTSLSLLNVMKFELDRACGHVTKLIQEREANRCDIDILLKLFEEEKIMFKLKEQDRVHSSITSMARELDTERKLRRQTERLNKKLGKELAETRESLVKTNKDLESEKRAREILEQVCEELARGIGEDRAEVEELRRQSANVCEEVEKEREMLQLADILREERVQMKLSEAKYQFEEKNAVVDKLRHELETYLKSKKCDEQEIGSPSYDKIKELEEYLKETLPCSYDYEDNYKNEIEIVNNNDDDDEWEEDGDSGDTDLHSLELRIDDINKSFRWSDDVRKESNRNSTERSTKIKKAILSSETKLEREFITSSKGENLDAFEKRGLFEFATRTRKKKDIEDEIERYNMIKDLRDHIVSGSKMASFQESTSPNPKVTTG